jgi:Flp pilus assembly protein TadG
MRFPSILRGHKQKGQASVEFAFIFPIFLGVFIGLVFFSLLFYSYVTLQLAVRQGASLLVHNPQDTIYTIRRTVCTSGFAFAPAQMTVYVEPPDTYPTCSASSGCSCATLNPSDAANGVYSGWESGVSFAVTGYYTVPLPNVSIPTTSGSVEILGPIQISAKSVVTFD